MLLVPKETLSEATIPLSLEEQRRGQNYYLEERHPVHHTLNFPVYFYH